MNQHPQIGLGFEAAAFCVPFYSPTSERWPQWADHLELWNRTFTRHHITPDERARIRSARDLYQIIAARKGAAFYGEKSPASSRWLKKLARHFPEARFILVSRPLEDTYGSVQDASRKGNFTFGRSAHLPRICAAYQRLTTSAQQLEASGVPILHVSYDELLEQTAELMKRVCSFLDLEFDPAVASLENADLSPVWTAPLHDHVRGGEIIRRQSDASSTTTEHAQRLLAGLRGRTSGQSDDRSLLTILELWALTFLGDILYLLTDIKRLLYERIPLEWLKAYRGRLKESD